MGDLQQPVVDGMSELSLSRSSNGEQQPAATTTSTESSSNTATSPSSVDALVDPSTEGPGSAPSSVPAANGISQSVAEIYKPEASDGSTSVVDSDPIQPSPPSSSQAQLLDPKLQAIAAIKCRDFASSPPPVRPAPTATGQALSTSIHANGIKGLASAPAVQTLATTTPNSNSTSSTSQDMALSTSAPESGTSTPTPSTMQQQQSQQQRPAPTTRPSQLGTGAGAGSGASTPGVRRPGQGGAAGLATRIPPSLQAKMAAMASRSNNPTSINLAQNTHLGAGERIQTSSLFKPSSSSSSSTSGTSTPGGIPSLAGRPSMAPGAPGRVGAQGPASSAGGPQSRGPMMGGGMAPPGGGLARRRGPGAGLTLGAMGASAGSSTGAGAGAGPPVNGINGTGAPPGRMNRPKMQLPGGTGDANGASGSGSNASGSSGGAGGKGAFSNFSKIVDPSGSLNFQNKAVLHAKGVDFSNGSSFNINMDELQLQDELGSGAYGTVQKVYHKVTKVTMAMKEIRLELDDSKLKGIITELDILHRATAPEIVDFYGAFFIEGCVYYCMEYMDAGSLDKFAGCPIPEPVLQRVTASIVRGLKFLKDELQTMHRDIKPTNVLVNTAGAIKLCDFGVSGQLERSLAKTNIGCQSYMAPERIKGESLNFLGTYTVASDVWSLGLCIIEFCVGHYPYPPETYSNVFAQLQAIVHGDPPGLPDGYSKEADNFVAGCLQKDANKRPNYGQMLQHPFLKDEATLDIDMQAWVKECLGIRASKKAAALAGSAPSTPAVAAPPA